MMERSMRREKSKAPPVLASNSASPSPPTASIESATGASRSRRGLTTAAVQSDGWVRLNAT